MKPWLKNLGRGVGFLLGGILCLLRWTLWLALCLLLVLQAWIALSREFAVPSFVLRMFEQRLAASQVRATFGHARFDPSGRIVVDDLRLSLPAFREPVAVAQAAYVELDPWALLGGRFEPHRLEVSGVRLAVPAMLSRSGQAEDMVRDLDATLELREHEIVIEHLTARIAGVAVTARGSLHFNPRAPTHAEPLPIADYLAAHYPDICRQVIRVADRLAVLEQPELSVTLTPSNTRGALASITVLAQGLKLDRPQPITARGLRLTTRFPLEGGAVVMSPVTLSADSIDVAHLVALTGVRARLRGALQPALYTYDPREILLSAVAVAARGIELKHVSARLQAGPLPHVTGDLVAQLAGEPVALRGDGDLARQAGTVQLVGAISPSLLTPLGKMLHHDLHRFIGFGAPVELEARVAFDPGWSFARLTGRFRAWQIDAYHVPMDEGGGEIELDRHHFIARHAYAILGPNAARGTFEQEFVDLRYRFLLEGRLRPLAISAWFHSWWTDFFDDFEFPLAPPDASVDVAGEWRQGHLTTVFVFGDSTGPVVRGVKFDHLRTLMFIRPHFLDGLELLATVGGGKARGTFLHQVDPATRELVSFNLDFDSTLDLAIPTRIFGSAVADQLAPFRVTHPPKLRMSAHFDGPAAPGGSHHAIQLEAQTTGLVGFNGFPLNDLAFKASIHDDDLALDDVTVNVAGGLVTGHARVWGRDAKRRLGFDLSLRNGSLGQAVRVMEEFSAARKGVVAPKPSQFVQDKVGVKLDLAASAEGLYADPFSFKGNGHAALDGAALGEVHLLGALSELFSFTSLRFTSARANFRIDGSHLVFSELTAAGANSAVDAGGSYDLVQHRLDIKARVNPFQESTFLPSVVIGAMLTPFSSALEVKLTGTLEKPKWEFVNSPTNLLRNLAKPNKPEPAPPTAPPDYLRR